MMGRREDGQRADPQLAHIAERHSLSLLSFSNPVLPFWRNIKFLSRYLYGFVRIGSLNSAKMFGALADDIDAPAGH
jgi:hypothetical protein